MLPYALRDTMGSEPIEISALTRQARRPGRPSAEQRSPLDRATIAAAAFEMTHDASLHDLSIVRVAKALGVTPALIHYYVGGRDQLTSAVMNLFYRELLALLPPPGGDWAETLRIGAGAMYRQFIAYPGITRFTHATNRFRVFQITEAGETDFGIEVLERFTRLVADAGRSAYYTGIYARLMQDFVLGSAHATISRRYPIEHRAFLEEKTAGLDQTDFPGDFPHARESARSGCGWPRSDMGCSLFIEGLRNGPPRD